MGDSEGKAKKPQLPAGAPESRSHKLIGEAQSLRREILAGHLGTDVEALARLDALIATFDSTIDDSHTTQDPASSVEPAIFDSEFEYELGVLTSWRDGIAARIDRQSEAGLVLEGAGTSETSVDRPEPEVAAVIAGLGPPDTSGYGWEATRRAATTSPSEAGEVQPGRRRWLWVVLILGAGALLLIVAALLLGSGALGGTAPASAGASASPGAAASATASGLPSEAVPAGAAEAIKDNVLVDNTGTRCTAPTTMHAHWVVTGVPARSTVAIDTRLH